ncbi:MAG: MFS transporter [Verrucomicrobiota bacterium]
MSAPVPASSDAQSGVISVPAVTHSRRWTIVFLLFVASMINYFDRATISFALPQISESLGLAPAAKGVLLSAFFWSYALMQIPVGLMADRLNLKWMYAAAFALWSLAQGFTGFATGLGMLIFFRIILGIGEAIYLPGGTKVVSLFFPISERGLPCGLFDFGTRTGLVLEGLLVPWLLKHYGWRVTFAVIGFSALVWLIPWLLLTPRTMRAPAQSTAPPAQEANRSHAPNFRELLVRGARYLCSRRIRDLIGICLGFFCFDYYWYLLVTWLPDYLVNVRQLTILKAGIYASLPFLIFGVSQPIGGWIADSLVRAGWDETRTRKGIVTLAFLTGLLLIPAALAESANMALLLLMLGCLVGLSTANQLVILQSCAPPEQVGLWTGIYNFVGNLAGIIAPLVTGLLIQEYGSYTPAFVLAAVMIAAGQLSYWFLVGDLKKQTPSLPGVHS